MRPILYFLFVVFSANSYAQSSATAKASVTILKSIGVNQEADMNFGEVMTGETNGTVVLFPDGSRTAVGGASFPIQSTRIPTAASFIVMGEESNYSISLPEEILLKDGQSSLKLNTFTHTASGSIEKGAETINIGATLHINGRQAPAIVGTNNDLRVTVQYK